MSIAETLLPEFDHEMSVTRNLLSLVPEDKASWKPHPKSFSVGSLAAHIAEIPGWGAPTLQRTELDLAPADGPKYVSPQFESRKALLENFDRAVHEARKAVMAASDADFQVPWALLAGGKEIFKLPRIAVFRSFIVKHIVHHRGQLTVYYRLLDIPLPSIYGPTADTPM